MSSGITGVNSHMADMMRILMQSVNTAGNRAEAVIAVGVENKLAADKMAIAQAIIDAYA